MKICELQKAYLVFLPIIALILEVVSDLTWDLSSIYCHGIKMAGHSDHCSNLTTDRKTGEKNE